VFSLAETLTNIICLEREIPNYSTNPMPVLQGWKPQDYADCIHLMEDYVWNATDPLKEIRIDGWPSLLGLGSVCRRQLHGPDGLIAVLNTVDKHLPPHVKLHLFGVKSQAVEALKEHPRIQSVDSMAWNLAARWSAFKNKIPKTQTMLAGHLQEWVERQRTRAHSPQLALC